jgi:hypothetical protein
MKLVAVWLLSVATVVHSQAPGKWPPDSLVNTHVIARTTSVTAVWGQMRTIAFSLGVECTYCHVGEPGTSLARIDFISDEKRTKLVARQMLRMVQEINRRIDTLPGRGTSVALTVTCSTCHRGLPRPVPLVNIVTETAVASSADSAIRVYQRLRQQYFGGDSYDFREPTLSSAAFRVGRAGKFNDALFLLDLNETLFPGSSAMYVIRGNIQLMRTDTSAAAAAFREAIRRDSTNDEARGRLRDIRRPPHSR